MPDSPPDATKRERTVGDIMSHPVVTARAGRDARRSRDRACANARSARSSSSTHDERAIGILTERDMIRLAAAGSDASTAKVSEWMTADPTRSRPTSRRATAFATLSEHGYRHIPVVDGRPARRHRVDARPHAHRDDPARRGAGPRGPEGPRRRRRRRDDGRRRARPRGLLPLPPVQRGRPRPAAAARRRLAPDVRRRAPRDRRRARRVRGRRSAPGRADPRRGRATCCPRSRARASSSCRSTRCAPRSRSTAPRSASSRRSTSTHATLYDNAMSTCAVVPTLITALWRLRQGLEPVDPRDDLGYAANYLYMMHGEEPTRRARGRASRST